MNKNPSEQRINEDMLLAKRAEEAEKKWIEEGCQTISHEELCKELGIEKN